MAGFGAPDWEPICSNLRMSDACFASAAISGQSFRSCRKDTHCSLPAQFTRGETRKISEPAITAAGACPYSHVLPERTWNEPILHGDAALLQFFAQPR
jgi:hypothetical protein